MMPVENIKKRSRLSLDRVKNEPVITEMTGSDKRNYDFGEDIGLLVFRPWYNCISYPKHFAYAKSYDFPVRIAFVDEPVDPQGFIDGRVEWRGWNLPNWIHAAKQLQEDGVKAIVGGCGLTGAIQSLIAAELDIPFYSSTVLFAPLLHKSMAKGKRIGILTVSEEQLRVRDNVLLKECGVTDDMPIVVRGMNEAEPEDTNVWLTMTTDAYDKNAVEQAIVNTAVNLKNEYPDLGMFLLECTEMPVYSEAIRQATGLPVFDALDMVNMVQRTVCKN